MHSLSFCGYWLKKRNRHAESVQFMEGQKAIRTSRLWLPRFVPNAVKQQEAAEEEAEREDGTQGPKAFIQRQQYADALCRHLAAAKQHVMAEADLRNMLVSLFLSLS
jgi:hypothetical protein